VSVLERPWSILLACLAPLCATTCSTPAPADPPSSSSSTSAGDSTSLVGTTNPDATATATDPDSTGASTGPVVTGTDDTATTTGPPSTSGCPDDLPASWILCEDFETPGGPETYFGWFWTRAGLMAVESGEAWSGERALRIGHDPAVFGSGMADLRFGQGTPGGVVHQPDGQFREVWVRFWLRTQPGWPDAGIAEAVEVMSVTGDTRAIAMDATIYSPTQAQVQALAWSCVHDSDLWCNGSGDWSNPSLEVRESGLGSSDLYGAAMAGQWQCHEIHVRLDDPGESNGQFEVSVDGRLEVSLQEITFFDAWAGAAINNVRFGSFWNAPALIDHHVDDVVVATAPVGCPAP